MKRCWVVRSLPENHLAATWSSRAFCVVAPAEQSTLTLEIRHVFGLNENCFLFTRVLTLVIYITGHREAVELHFMLLLYCFSKCGMLFIPLHTALR